MVFILVGDQEYSDGPTTSPQGACSDAQLRLGRCTGQVHRQMGEFVWRKNFPRKSDKDTKHVYNLSKSIIEMIDYCYYN